MEFSDMHRVPIFDRRMPKFGLRGIISDGIKDR